MGFTIPVSFGAGLDRASGSSSGEVSDFSDLRNVALGEGKAALRTGMIRRSTLGAGVTDILAITALRSLGIGAAVAYSDATSTVSLWLLSGDGITALFVANLYVLPAGAPFPRIIATDSYGQLFIAHDEPTFAFRQNTKVYDPQLGIVSDVTADLNTATPGAVAVKYRGVERWLNYLVGWGYGTEDDGDRPEIVRISVAGEPTNFKPNQYFLAGQRGDAVLRCARTTAGLLVLKATEAYLIHGSSPANFGIDPVDDRFGVIGSHLAVTVGGTNYRWSSAGPRRSDGGESDDLALPLDIGGPLVDPLADTSAGDYAFAEYLPVEREIVFCFGTWAYVLHLKNPAALRWSYRVFGVLPSCLGTLLDSGGSALGPAAHPLIGVISPGSHALDVAYTSSGALTTERVELWERYSQLDGSLTPWTRLVEKAATAGETLHVDGLFAGRTHYIALRFLLNGLAITAYSSADASAWPAFSRGTGIPGF